MKHTNCSNLVALAGALLGAAIWLSPPSARAQSTSAPPSLAEVVVSAESTPGLSLDARPRTGSSLGLTARETPATIDVLTQRQIQDLGARTTEEALNRATGVSASNHATAPGTLSLRGFTGSGRAALLLYDGVRPVEEAFFTRVIDSWLFERIEVLKGPSSVDYGEGALAGVVNLVPKRARLDGWAFAGQVGYGSFDSFRAAADANVVVLDELAIRPVVAYNRSSGYVDDTSSDFLAGALSATWSPSRELVVELAIDYQQDDYDTAYFGTPLVPRAVALEPSGVVESADGRVLDRSLRAVNYNVEDGVTDSTTGWLRSSVRWQAGGGWTLSNDLHLYTSERSWINAEIFGFDAESGLVNRSTGIVTHDIDYWIDRVTLRGDHQLAGFRNRLVVGGSYSEVSFRSVRRFGDTTAVDLRSPERGRFPVGDDPMLFPSRANWDSSLRVTSAFAEDALNLTSGWLVLGGVRYDRVSVDRASLDLNAEPPARTPTERELGAVTWRVGSVFDLLPDTQLFASYSTAAAPPSSLLTLSPDSARFDMTRGWAVEGGVKSALFDDRLELTAAAFYIVQDDIVTRSPADPNVSVQGGRQSSRGAEISLSAVPFDALRLLVNYSHFDARFDELIDASGSDRGGNTPQRVPEQILNAFVFVEAPVLPLTASFGMHRAGRYFTDDANDIEVGGYATFEAALRYRLAFDPSTTDITLRARNLTNTFHASYTGLSPTQLTLAPPRSVDLMVTVSY